MGNPTNKGHKRRKGHWDICVSCGIPTFVVNDKLCISCANINYARYLREKKKV